MFTRSPEMKPKVETLFGLVSRDRKKAVENLSLLAENDAIAAVLVSNIKQQEAREDGKDYINQRIERVRTDDLRGVALKDP